MKNGQRISIDISLKKACKWPKVHENGQKHMTRCSLSLVRREIKVKTTFKKELHINQDRYNKKIKREKTNAKNYIQEMETLVHCL